MKLLVLGARGQVGWELRRSLQPIGSVVAVDRQECDLLSPGQLTRVVEDAAPDVIVNAAAYTAVDKAEQEEALARRINAEVPAELAALTRRSGALLVHYSTDYVFDGSKPAPYEESDEPAPLNAYGRTKLAGERAIAEQGGDWLILRTTWVYASRGANFARTMLRLAAEREKLSIVDDQFGAPTSARFLADATAQLMGAIRAERAAGGFASGLFHLCAAGSTSWHGFATAVIDGARRRGAALKVAEIAGIPALQYPTPARRPANSRLSTQRIEARFGLRVPFWQEGVELVLDEMLLH